MTALRIALATTFERAADSFFKKGGHRIAGASLLALFCGIGFTTIGLFNRHRFGLSFTPPLHAFSMDARIPFEPAWVWVYILYYPFCFLPLCLKEVRNDPVIFLRSLTVFAIQFAVSFSFFLLLPWRVTHGSLPVGINGQILGALYGFDLGFNSFPSLHLANIVAVCLLFKRFSRKYYGAAVFAGAMLIAVSTMLVKQHFISDVILGILLGWGSFTVVFWAESHERGPMNS